MARAGFRVQNEIFLRVENLRAGSLGPLPSPGLKGALVKTGHLHRRNLLIKYSRFFRLTYDTRGSTNLMLLPNVSILQAFSKSIFRFFSDPKNCFKIIKHYRRKHYKNE